jgi:hypothetical protein
MSNELDNLENKDVLDLIKSREIVQEIMNFGVNDFQIMKIIKLLALELTSRETMNKICTALNEDEVQKPKIEL